MTREQAQDVESFDKAIQTLEQEPCGDAISRQAVLDAIRKIHPVDTEYNCTLYDKVDVMYVLENLPSVTPQPCDDAISRQMAIDALKDIKDLQGRNLFAEKGLFPWNVIAQLPSVTPQQRTGRWIEHDFEQLRKMGYYRCSECNIGYQRYERGERKSELPNINGQKYELHRIDNYCPNCGAKMVEE